MNRRVFQGTIPTLTPGVQVGGDFELQPNASFVADRLALFDELKAAREAERAELLKTNPPKPITIELPSGDVKEGQSEVTTPQMIAEQIKVKGCIVARVIFLEDVKESAVDALDDLSVDDVSDDGHDENSRLWDMNRPLPASCKLELLKFDDPDAKHVFWHSSAHLLGLSVEQAFGAKVCIGPALQNGFYYDFYTGDKLAVSDSHYAQIEKKASEAVATQARFERLEITKDEAKYLFQENPFKLAIIDSKVPEGVMTTVYRCGPFVDLCMGPHLPHLGWIKAFVIEKHSAAYWLGDSKGDSLQRVYGIAFPDAKLLKEHKKRVEEAKQRDHRLLGQKLGFFFFEPIYAPGCAFWTPMGTRIYNKLIDFIRLEYRYRGFDEVTTPNLCSSDLFKVSGHWQNYKDCMFVLDVEGKEWGLKPMNCPTHCCIFKHMNLSYRQLPIRIADFAALHRNEFSGSLTGLTRVRRFQQDDAHIFCELHQVQKEVAGALEFLQHCYHLFGFTFKVVLSTRPKKALGELSLWNTAEKQLADALDESEIPWSINKGDGAFYGPKIDIKVFDALGRSHQCGTIQLDFQLPIRFNLQYKTAENFEKTEEANKATDEKPAVDNAAPETAKPEAASPAKAVADETSPATAVAEVGMDETQGKAETKLRVLDGSLETEVRPGFARPVMIHRAILGSVERFTAVLIEHFAGKLPFWLSPRQALVCPISEKSSRYAAWLKDVLNLEGYDVDVDTSNSTINKKIREASIYYWNYMLVVGEKEEADRTIAVRCREDPQRQKIMTLPELLELFEGLRNVAKRSQPEYNFS
ncbi:threonyl-tRNA synthetase [Gregarina niphandrodes]|uniref:threonine--tRNA ligase n=1 Tax=Gregarina niphandrodes TaxID=110365 RepID=A0A023B2L9_GRENI|nr:threonyl-tRNA synthetase [Gregarina niphandrodes]EZG55086.1 threonyl-tRNA synthetase [Gregarina niphandrodes]|eukprot:XP_011131789.1 threonyl-tRNA synthetase [Gregarina niphandrodes]